MIPVFEEAGFRRNNMVPLTQTVFRFPSEFKLPGFFCISENVFYGLLFVFLGDLVTRIYKRLGNAICIQVISG